MINNKKGITLIALVVTIVVLLILAGISIQMLKGENGIIKKAQEAAQRTEEAQKNEEEELRKVSDYLTGVEVEVEVTTTYSIDYNSGNENNKGKNLICVYTNSTDVWYTYKGRNMYDISDSGYTYKGSEYKTVFGIFIDNDEEFSKDNIKRVEVSEVSNGIKIDYGGDKYDVNRSGTVDLRDATATVSVYNSDVNYFEDEDIETGMNNCFRADVNRDKKVNEEDTNLVQKNFST